MTTTRDQEQTLARAAEHILSMGVPDAATSLCAANMTYGLAKMHWVQRELGFPADAHFIGTPDMTITRNSGRWRAGIGYGGRLSWGDGSRDLLILDVKPNTCGMLIGGLPEQPDAEQLTRRLHALHGCDNVVDGIPIEWDFGTGNHFVDVYEVSEESVRRDLPAYAFVMHASGAELRGETAHGPGLYWDESEEWRRRCTVAATPWGPLHVLHGQAARDYMAFHNSADAFALRRREYAARELFGDFTLLANSNHQGLINANEILLGCQSTTPGGRWDRSPDLSARPSRGSRRLDDGDTRDSETGETPVLRGGLALLPIMVRADRPAFLMHGLPNLADDQIARLGFSEAAERHGLMGQLRNANVIPHGAGYSLPHLSRVRRVIEIGETRYFELERAGQRDTQIISDPKDLTCGYRDEEVVHLTVECGLGTVAARLEPLFVLKT